MTIKSVEFHENDGKKNHYIHVTKIIIINGNGRLDLKIKKIAMIIRVESQLS